MKNKTNDKVLFNTNSSFYHLMILFPDRVLFLVLLLHNY